MNVQDKGLSALLPQTQDAAASAIDLRSATTLPSNVQPGSLTGKTVLTVHTRQAFRMIKGRPKDTAAGKALIPGLAMFANFIRAVRQGSTADDPWADAMLIDVENQIEQTNKYYTLEQERLTQALSMLDGLSFNTAISAQPIEIELSFGNPYGYLAAQTAAHFDTLAKLILQCHHVGVIDRPESERLLKHGQKMFRRIVCLPMQYQLARCTRQHVLLNNEKAQRAIALLGPIDRAIVEKKRMPRFSGSVAVTAELDTLADDDDEADEALAAVQ